MCNSKSGSNDVKTQELGSGCSLTRNASEFRRAIEMCELGELPICLQNFPYGACGDASYLLAKYLAENNCGEFEYVMGIRRSDEYSHAWLEQNRVIIDITADQFEDVESKVVVTTDFDWYQQFESQERSVADFEIFDSVTASSLRNGFEIILSKIQ